MTHVISIGCGAAAAGLVLLEITPFCDTDSIERKLVLCGLILGCLVFAGA